MTIQERFGQTLFQNFFPKLSVLSSIRGLALHKNPGGRNRNAFLRQCPLKNLSKQIRLRFCAVPFSGKQDEFRLIFNVRLRRRFSIRLVIRIPQDDQNVGIDRQIFHRIRQKLKRPIHRLNVFLLAEALGFGLDRNTKLTYTSGEGFSRNVHSAEASVTTSRLMSGSVLFLVLVRDAG